MGGNNVGQDRPIMRERLTIQRNDPPAIAISSVTRVGAVVTVVTATPHGYASTDYVTLAGADGATTAYNGKWKITVTGASAFTFPITGSPATPATGTITAVYTSNAQGGQGVNFWRELATVRAEMVPIRSQERLQLAAIQSNTTFRFRIRSRADVVSTQRALWTPRWPPGSTQQTLEITGVIPDDSDLTYTLLEAAVA